MILGIDPKVDYAFKKLFGSESNKSLLIDLLNAVLASSISEPLVDVDILNPFNDKDLVEDKLSVLDIKARDRSGRLYNIEMQIAVGGVYKKRVLFYWSRLYQQQLKEGDDYRQLMPTISISFINGVHFPGLLFHYEFKLLSRQDPAIEFSPDLSIHVIELPKFAVQLDRLSDPLERWCYFLRYGENLETSELPTGLKTPSIEKAVEVLRVMTQNEIERERYESRQKAIRDYQSFLESARDEALEQGREQGLEQGREQGLRDELSDSIGAHLEFKFGESGKNLGSQLKNISDIAKLRTIQRALWRDCSMEEIRSLVGD